MIGAKIAWIISAFSSEVIFIPSAIVAPHNAHPANAYARRTLYLSTILNLTPFVYMMDDNKNLWPAKGITGDNRFLKIK